jgi:hypothetical protein
VVNISGRCITADKMASTTSNIKSKVSEQTPLLSGGSVAKREAAEPAGSRRIDNGTFAAPQPPHVEEEVTFRNRPAASGPSEGSEVTKESGDAPGKPSDASLPYIFASLFMVVFLASLDSTIVATVYTKIGSEFNRSNGMYLKADKR